MRYFLHPNVCNLVTLVKATPSGQEGSNLCGKGCQFISPRRTMPKVSGFSAPWGLCGLVLWLVKTHFPLNSAQKLQEDLPREEKNLTGSRDVGPAQKTSPLPTGSPGCLGGEDFTVWNLVAKKKKKMGFTMKGTLFPIS